MKCVYAFLLIPREGLESTRRLAIVSDGIFRQHYDVFIPKPDELFPAVESRTGIKTTEFSITGPGTYPRAYCSNTISTDNLVKYVTRNLNSAYDKSHLGFGGADKAADKCLEELENLSISAEESYTGASNSKYRQLSTSDSSYKSIRKARKSGWERLQTSEASSHRLEKPPKILLSKIRETTGCSDLGLINLAYQKKIRVTGFDSYFAPEYPEAEYEVEFDGDVDINQVVLGGQLFAPFKYQNKYYVLAWYMGHLHVFKKNTVESRWWPETPIGSEKNNGDMIFDFISRNYKVLNPVTKLIDEYDHHQYTSECCFINCSGSDREFRQECNRIVAEIGTLKLRRLPVMGETIT